MSLIKSKSGEISLALVAAIFATSVLADDKLKLSVSAGLEYDDNISVPSLDQTTGKSDVAAVFDFSASYTPIKNDTTELELNYDIYQSLHDTFDDFDLQIHTLSALGSWEVNEFDTGLAYSYSRVYLGGSELYGSNTITPSIGFSGLQDWYHLASYAYQDKNFFSISGRDAQQNSITLDNYFFFMDNQAYFSLKIRGEDEDAKDAQLDYQGALMRAGLSIPVSDYGFTLKASYQHYWRDYDNTTISIGEKRDDEQDLVNVDLIKPLSKDIDIKLSYEYTNAKSNLPSADYNGNVASVNFMMDF